MPEKTMRIIENKGEGPHNLGPLPIIEGFNYVKKPEHLKILKKYEKQLAAAKDLHEHDSKATAYDEIPIEKALGYIHETNSYDTLKAWADTDKRPEVQAAVKARIDEEKDLTDAAKRKAQEDMMRRRSGM